MLRRTPVKGDLVFVQKGRSTSFGILLQTPRPNKLYFTSISPDGHLMLHSESDIRFTSLGWAFSDRAKKALDSQRKSAGLTSEAIEMLKKIGLKPEVLTHLFLFKRSADVLQNSGVGKVAGLHSILKPETKLSLDQLAFALFKFENPTPAECWAASKLVADNLWFKSLEDCPYCPTYVTRPKVEADRLLSMIEKSDKESKLSQFLQKARKLIKAHRSGISLKVPFTSHDLVFINQAKILLQSKSRSDCIERKAVYQGIIKALGTSYSLYPSSADLILFLKEIGVFTKQEDTALIVNNTAGSTKQLGGVSPLGDLLTKEAEAYCEELVKQGPFVYDLDGTTSTKSSVESASHTIEKLQSSAFKGCQDQITLGQLKSSPIFSTQDPLEKLRVEVSEPVFVIDDINAHELDDGISLERTTEGDWIHVHIADPTAYIPPSHPLSHLAQLQSNSIYLPQTHFPMMPDFLSNKLLNLGTSLGAMTFSARLDSKGEICDYKVTPTLIRNAKLVKYDDVDTVLSWENIVGFKDQSNLVPWVRDHFKSCYGRPKSTAIGNNDVETLNRLQSLAHSHLENRTRNGGFIPDLLGYSIKVKEADIPLSPHTPATSFEGEAFKTSTTISLNPFNAPQRSPSRLLVAECMVLAGRVAAKYASERKIPMGYRTQISMIENVTSKYPEPEFADQARTVTDLITHNIDAASCTVPESIYRLAMPFMSSATISTQPQSHYAMGVLGTGPFAGYLKVTSPLRRYQDLHTHYQLQASLLNVSYPFSMEDTIAINARTVRVQKGATQIQRKSERFWGLEYLRRKAEDGAVGGDTGKPYILKGVVEGSESHVVIVTGYLRDTNSYLVSLPYFGGFSVRVSAKDAATPLKLGTLTRAVFSRIVPETGLCVMVEV